MVSYLVDELINIEYLAWLYENDAVFHKQDLLNDWIKKGLVNHDVISTYKNIKADLGGNPNFFTNLFEVCLHFEKLVKYDMIISDLDHFKSRNYVYYFLRDQLVERPL